MIEVKKDKYGKKEVWRYFTCGHCGAINGVALVENSTGVYRKCSQCDAFGENGETLLKKRKKTKNG